MATIIAIDLGGTNLRVAIIDENYQILRVDREATITGDKPALLNQIATMIEGLGLDHYHPEAINIGVPGRVHANGFIEALPNVGIDNIDLKPFLEHRFNLPTTIINDAEIAGLGEATVGAGKSKESTFFVTISTGIGGTYVEHGRIKQFHGEIGHTLFPYKGGIYEIERIASGTGIVRLAELNGLSLQSAAAFFKMIENHEPKAMAVYEDWLQLVSDFFAYIISAFDPEIIVMTGGMMKSAHLFFDHLKSRFPHVKIARAAFDQDAGLIGAAALSFVNK